MDRIVRRVDRLAGAIFVTVLFTVPGGCTLVGGGRGEFRDPDGPPAEITAADVAREIIDPGDMRRHVSFLSSDQLWGQATASQGLQRAAAWTAERFQLAGLDPAGEDGGYIQYWQVGGDTASNVVALLPGSDLTRAGEYVVLVAHLDHLGVADPPGSGDSIDGSAADHATGVAALAEIAQAFAALPARPARPVVFLVVSGTEGGARGSSWYLQHPTLDLSGTVAVLNLDMIGGNHPDSVAVLDRDAPELGALLAGMAAASPALGLALVRQSRPASVREGVGDAAGAGAGEGSGSRTMRTLDRGHAPFAGAGFPAVTLSTGRQENYYRPAHGGGRPDEGKLVRVARLVFLTAYELAVSGSP